MGKGSFTWAVDGRVMRDVVVLALDDADADTVEETFEVTFVPVALESTTGLLVPGLTYGFTGILGSGLET